MVKIREFGCYQGKVVQEAVLSSPLARVAILNYGCVIRDWRVASRGGEVPVVLGFDTFPPYPAHSPYFGIIAGRVANRTAAARFELNGREYNLSLNDGAHHLHGGHVGLGRRVWDMEVDSAANAVRLTYHSPDGEEGYPANVDFSVVYCLSGTTLTCQMEGVPDVPTPINLAQHNYYNLNGGGDVCGHQVRIAASAYTPVDQSLIPTGEITSSSGHSFDFNLSKTFNDINKMPLDINLILDDTKEANATVYSSETGLELNLWTQQRGLQLFNAPDMDIPVKGHNGQIYRAFSGLCLEPQHLPDSLNNLNWPSIICTPDKPYTQKLVVDIAPRS